MIKAAKELEFTSNEELFNYVLESLINGQRAQVRELISSIRRSRAIGEFIYWLNDTPMDISFYRELKEMI